MRPCRMRGLWVLRCCHKFSRCFVKPVAVAMQQSQLRSCSCSLVISTRPSARTCGPAAHKRQRVTWPAQRALHCKRVGLPNACFKARCKPVAMASDRQSLRDPHNATGRTLALTRDSCWTRVARSARSRSRCVTCVRSAFTSCTTCISKAGSAGLWPSLLHACASAAPSGWQHKHRSASCEAVYRSRTSDWGCLMAVRCKSCQSTAPRGPACWGAERRGLLETPGL